MLLKCIRRHRQC